MRYIISRSSSFSEKPHPDAVGKFPVLKRDIRTFKDKQEWLSRFPHDEKRAIEWGVTESGLPFRIVSSSGVEWIIDIPDLLAFVKENGQCILHPPPEEYLGELEGLYHIEIYDDWRE